MSRSLEDILMQANDVVGTLNKTGWSSVEIGVLADMIKLTTQSNLTVSMMQGLFEMKPLPKPTVN